MTATLRVEREPGQWVNLLRAYKLRVNGETVGKIRSGHSLEVPVDHDTELVVKVKIDWTGSNEWVGTLGAGQTGSFYVGHTGLSDIVKGMFSTSRYLRLTRR